MINFAHLPFTNSILIFVGQTTKKAFEKKTVVLDGKISVCSVPFVSTVR